MARVLLLACALALVACATAMPYQDSCVGSMEFASIDVLTFTRGQSTVPCLTSHARAPQLTARPRPGGLQQVELAYAFCVRSGIGWNCGAVGWTNNYRITAPSVECEPSETTWGAVFPSMCTLTYTVDFDVDYKPTTLDMEAQADWNLAHEAAGPVDPSLLHATKYVRDPAVRSKFFPTLATDAVRPVPTEPTERKRYTPEGTKVYDVTAGMRIDPRTLPNPDLLPDGWEAIVDDRGYIAFQMTRETFAKSSDPWGVKDLPEVQEMIREEAMWTHGPGSRGTSVTAQTTRSAPHASRLAWSGALTTRSAAHAIRTPPSLALSLLGATTFGTASATLP